MLEIRDMSVHTFWKGEAEVRAQVLDNGEACQVSLSIRGSRVYDYTCTCDEYRPGKMDPDGAVLCPHARAVWNACREQQERQSGHSVSTSQEIRAMIREYTNREVAQIIRESEERQVRLIPTVCLEGCSVWLEWKLGAERTYLLKDLVEFAQAVENGANVSYGKQLEFHHSIQAFAPEDRPLAEFLLDQVNAYRESYAQFKKSIYAAVPGLRRLRISRAGCDRFFELVMGRVIQVEAGPEALVSVQITTEPFPLKLKLKKAGRDGVSVSIPKELYGFSGERFTYLGDGTRLTRYSEQASQSLKIFLEQILSARGGHELEVNERDLPLFSERVLSRILPFCRLDAEGVNLEDYRTQELKARFTFDSTRKNELTMRPELSYGSYTFVPMEDERVPRTICRDVPGEFRISQVITKYFSYRSADGQTLVIRDNDDALYRLLKDGIPEFMALGEVCVSEAAKKIRVAPPPAVTIGLKLSGGWLDLTVEAEGVSRAELARILSEYDPARPYYRLKNGEFLQLDDNGLLTVARMVKGLAVTRTQLSGGSLHVPAYRALYLDSLLKDQNGVTLSRDKWFRAMVRGMKSVEDSDFVVPESLMQVLRGYQKTGFRWLRTLDAYGFGGILADDMGLGKTIQIIALLLDEKERRPGGCSLIVCPASLIYNWENEIRRFAPALSTLVVGGTAAERSALIKKAREAAAPAQKDDAKAGGADAVCGLAPDVLVTSYDLLKRDVEQYQDFPFRFEVIDEAQFIKNPATQSAHAVKLIRARTRFALTGTPIENRISELWSIFDYLMPGILFQYPRFRRDFETPIMKEQDASALTQLRRLTGPFILRRLKKDVLKELPENQELVVSSRAGEEQRRLYDAYALKLKQELEEMDGGALDGERFQILAELTHLRQLCCDPALCVNRYKGGSAKLETLIGLLRTAVDGGHKILVFSQFTAMLDRIAARLSGEGLLYHMLTGATPKEERIHLAGAFQNDNVPVFLISLKAGGTGLNLTAADIVIHYDPWWNVAAQNQATDRTHRIGQERQVTVYQLILKDTIEENIRTLQEQKQKLARQIIQEGAVPMSSLTREELIGLLGADSQEGEEDHGAL